MKARGWRVFATARTPGDLDRLAGAGLEAIPLDYTEPASIAACVSHVLSKTDGRLDALFNNGAHGQLGAVEDLPVEALRAQFETNVFGWHDLTRQVIPAMRRQGHGRIVQCSSVLGLVALKWRGAYTASKFAIEALSATMRLELAGSGIDVALIEPGPIHSRFTQTALAWFDRYINAEDSPHRLAYAERRKRLAGEATPSRFKLPPQAVLRKLIHACESASPKPHYYVTVPTYALAGARRVLPYGPFYRLMAFISDRS